jgi:hypothetical protein
MSDMEFPDYLFYTATYGGTMDMGAFTVNLEKAKVKFDAITFSRDVPENMEAQTKFAVCALCDAFKAEKERVSKGTGTVKSEKVDGYNITYTDGETKNIFAQTVKSIAEDWLSYPVNLIYSGREYNGKLAPDRKSAPGGRAGTMPA